MLVTGASGFLGTSLTRRLAEDARYQLVGTVRREAVNLASGFEPVIVGDLGADTDWTQALSGAGVVIHTAARVHVMNDSAKDPLSEFRKVNVKVLSTWPDKLRLLV